MQEVQWWYVNSRQSEGLVDLVVLCCLQQDGMVMVCMLLWCEGMFLWCLLVELEQDLMFIEMVLVLDIDIVLLVEVVVLSVGDLFDLY